MLVKTFTSQPDGRVTSVAPPRRGPPRACLPVSRPRYQEECDARVHRLHSGRRAPGRREGRVGKPKTGAQERVLSPPVGRILAAAGWATGWAAWWACWTRGAPSVDTGRRSRRMVRYLTEAAGATSLRRPTSLQHPRSARGAGPGGERARVQASAKITGDVAETETSVRVARYVAPPSGTTTARRSAGVGRAFPGSGAYP